MTADQIPIEELIRRVRLADVPEQARDESKQRLAKPEHAANFPRRPARGDEDGRKEEA